MYKLNRSPEALRRILNRTSGLCHLCRKRLVFKNYGVVGARGCWEIEHSKPQAKGGTHHANNLYAACCSCNRKKRDRSNYVARKASGFRTAPLSPEKAASARVENTVVTGGASALIGGIFFGPAGFWIGGAVGAYVGNKADPHGD